jgi:hypothetical protein
MTLKQMEAIAITAVGGKAPTIIIPSKGQSVDEMFQAESVALQLGVCPRCSAKVEHQVQLDKTHFTCTRHPVWHYFQRSANFLAFD